jgi:hypothetical protein
MNQGIIVVFLLILIRFPSHSLHLHPRRVRLPFACNRREPLTPLFPHFPEPIAQAHKLAVDHAQGLQSEWCACFRDCGLLPHKIKD